MILTAVSVVGVLVAGAFVRLPAQAAAAYIYLPSGSGKSACPLGYVCLWEHSEFTGRGVGFYNSQAWYEDLSATYKFIQNAASSAYNHGQYNDIRFGRFGSLDGGTIVLCKGDAIAYLNIGRNDGAIPGLGWNDEISSHQFFAAPYC
ncbi:hypothetical protein GCM10009555_029420 [Acrocarpospora macrocephala]|uniref:Peptidase inhibitor family I36 n=1 Tax=Acrocarpospora macrocephala TaxID=150177 RepID=A0A5M3WV21_9ACTN|nr:hypothetical protein Amac_047480 [Acrocarpospora macrocephala]